MALFVSDLQASFQSFLLTPPVSVADASQKWSNAYFTYALKATALDATPSAALAVVTSAPLAAAFLTSMQAQNFLDQLPNSLTTFWTGVPFIGTNSGAALAPTGTAAFVAAIKALKLANQKNRGMSALDDLATAIDAFTKTVVVSLISPAGAPIPTSLL